MAVTDNNAGGNQPQAAQQSNIPPHAGTAPQPQAQARRTHTPFVGGGLFAAPLPTALGSKQYAELKAKVADIFTQTTDPDIVLDILDLERANSGLAFSSMIIAARLQSEPDLGVAYTLLVLEGTGRRFEPITDTFANTTLTIQRPTEIAIDDVLLDAAEKVVQNRYPGALLRQVNATVVPTAFRVDDELALWQLALNAGLAVSQELYVNRADFADVNLVDFISRDSRLNINIGFTPAQVRNVVAEEMRADVTVGFTNASRNNRGGKYGSVNLPDAENTVSEVLGFLDLSPVAIAPPQGFYPQQYGQLPPQAGYAPRFVITNIGNNFSYTPGGVLLALLSSLELANSWSQGFRPQHVNPGEIDIRDIGAVNIEANVMHEKGEFGTPIDTKAPDFDLRDLGQYIGQLLQPGLLFSLDCPEAGPQTPYTAVFAAAALGSEDARSIIIDAADRLTNGIFRDTFPKGSPIFADNANRVHLGYWTDQKSRKRDLRDFDLIAAANILGRTNPSQIREWIKTFVSNDGSPIELLLSNRWKQIYAMSGETAVCTGTALRPTFSTVFLAALREAASRTGIQTTVTTPLTSADLNFQRPVNDYATQAMLPPGQVFQQQAYGQTNSPGYRFGGAGRGRYN